LGIEYYSVLNTSGYLWHVSAKPPPRVRRPPRHETRRRITDAAAQVFAETGYDAATLDQVAAMAGFTKGAVYSNFRDKEELFLTLMRERISQRVDLVREATDELGTPELSAAKAGALLKELLESQRDWHLLFIEFWARAVRNPRLRKQLAEGRRPMRRVIAELLDEQAARLGQEPPAPTEQLAVILLALSNGLAIEELADPGSFDPDIHAIALTLLLS
jgi:AcrR family transcriptional regulator